MPIVISVISVGSFLDNLTFVGSINVSLFYACTWGS